MIEAYSQTTRGIRIIVTPTFLDEQSDPADNHFVWAYTVTISNVSPTTVQLTGRTWLITDAKGITETVQGPGVVGEQPILREGDTFTYTSGCPLSTPSGLMRGHYDMRTVDGETFDAEIPAFSLDSPYDVRTLN
jgi:ApaG protein